MLKSQKVMCLLHRVKSPTSIVSQYRQLNTQSLRKVSSTASAHEATLTPPATPSPSAHSGHQRPLSLLPFPSLLRSYAITALSTYPLLLSPSLRILSYVAKSSSAFLNPDRNPIFHHLLKKTFYAQFCAGETVEEVEKTVKGLKDMGYKGVILGHGKEIVLEKDNNIESYSAPSTDSEVQGAETVVQLWKEGNLQTVEMAEDGDFVALKFSGAGCDAMRQLAANLPPSKAIEEATTEICELAKARGVRLLFDAEQDVVQRGIDIWTIKFQSRYNKTTAGQATVYGTYQAYRHSTPATLSRHLAIAQQQGFTLGVKLVRGAYMASDPRHLFWSTKEDTDKAYDGIAAALIRREWNSVLKPSEAKIPEVAFVLASHNQETVRKATALRKEQDDKGEPKIDMAYGQLMGMADEVSCELVMAAKAERGLARSEKRECMGPKAYKYAVWGSVGECLKYLVRRAEENRDAVTRAKGTRAALGAELGRRIWG